VTFGTPVALWGLTLLLGPVLVHLLSRRRAVRRPFPSLRFLEATRLPPVARRRLEDRRLLLLRLAILALAVLALARPVWPTRVASAPNEEARVIVEDTSASALRVTRADTSRRTVREVMRARADSIASEAGETLRVRSHDPASVLPAASAWLAARGGGELVVLTDGQPDVLRADDLTSLPAEVGVRTLLVEPAAGATIPAVIETVSTTVPIAGVEDARAFATLAARVSALLPTVVLQVDARPATPTPAVASVAVVVPQAVQLVDVPADPLVQELVQRHGWPRVLPATGDASSSETSVSVTSPEQASSLDAWRVRDPEGRVLLEVHTSDSVSLAVRADATHPVTAALVAVTLERLDAGRHPERRELDARVVDAETLASWQRPAVRASRRSDRDPTSDDAAAPSFVRGLWALVLLLLLAEGAWRARLARARHDDVAAPPAVEGA
jgi:hypothetical protein